MDLSRIALFAFGDIFHGCVARGDTYSRLVSELAGVRQYGYVG